MDQLFKVHQLNDAGMRKATQIAEVFDTNLKQISLLMPDNNRYFSIVKTKLEEACFFAKKGMAEQPENCKAATLTEKL